MPNNDYFFNSTKSSTTDFGTVTGFLAIDGEVDTYGKCPPPPPYFAKESQKIHKLLCNLFAPLSNFPYVLKHKESGE